jgi:hypothetical protein
MWWGYWIMGINSTCHTWLANWAIPNWLSCLVCPFHGHDTCAPCPQLGFLSTYLNSQPPIQWVPGALSLVVKRSGREADHSPPSSAEWSYTSIPQYAFMAWCSVKAQGQLYLYLYLYLYLTLISIRILEARYSVSNCSRNLLLLRNTDVHDTSQPFDRISPFVTSRPDSLKPISVMPHE